MSFDHKDVRPMTEHRKTFRGSRRERKNLLEQLVASREQRGFCHSVEEIQRSKISIATYRVSIGPVRKSAISCRAFS